MSGKKRIVSLDVFRFLLVSAALMSHVLGRFDTWNALEGSQLLYLRLFTRGATPGLLILFGFMIEYIYVRYAQQHGLAFSVQRMVYRAMLCYMALVLIAVAGIVGLDTGLKAFVASILLVAPTINGDVFAQYLYVLFAIIPFISLRLRYGIGIFLAAIAGIWILDSLVLNPINPLIRDSLYSLNIHHIVGFLLGLGEGRGPSIFHGLTLVLFGMFLGHAFISRSRQATGYVLVLAGTALIILFYEISAVGWHLFLENIAEYDAYRAHNSIVYFAYGIVYTLLLVALAFGVNRLLSQGVRNVVTYLGSRTFIYFLVGNIVLNLLPNGLVTTRLWMSFVETALLSTLCYAAIHLWEARVNSLQPVVTVQKMMRALAGHLTTFLRRLAFAFPVPRASDT